jgi:hypothetical protein
MDPSGGDLIIVQPRQKPNEGANQHIVECRYLQNECIDNANTEYYASYRLSLISCDYVNIVINLTVQPFAYGSCLQAF